MMLAKHKSTHLGSMCLCWFWGSTTVPSMGMDLMIVILPKGIGGRECHLNTKTDATLGGLYLSLTVTKASAVPGRGKMFLSLSKVKAYT